MTGQPPLEPPGGQGQEPRGDKVQDPPGGQDLEPRGGQDLEPPGGQGQRPPGGLMQEAHTGPPAATPVFKVFPNVRQAILLLLLFFGASALAAVACMPLRAVSLQAWLLAVIAVGGAAGVFCGLRLARWPLARVLGNMGFSSRTLRWLLPIQLGNLLLIGSLLFGLTKVIGPVEPEFLDELFEVSGTGEFLLLFFTVAVAAPLVEELLFRGILLRGLTLSWGVRGGILWSAFFFALIHMNPLQAAPAFVNGLVWALVLLRTGSLGTTFFLHALNNGLVFLLVQMARVAEDAKAAGSGPALTPPPAAVQTAAAVGVALVGLWLVKTAVGSLPRAPGRLARFWDLPVSPAHAGAVAAGVGD